MSSDERCGLDEEAYARLLAELDRVEPRLAVATRAEQERLLDEAFERAGLDPDWATWQAVAREHLPAYRQGARRRYGVGSCGREMITAETGMVTAETQRRRDTENGK